MSTPNMIRVECTGFMGTWFAAVEFRPLRRGGYSVWATDLERDDDRLVKIDGSSAALSWRKAAESLQGVHRLIGNLLSSIEVSGVQSWQEDVLRIAWITEDNPAGDLLDYLLELPDEDIHYLWSQHGTLISDAALENLGRFCKALDRADLRGMSLAEVADELGLAKLPPLADLTAALFARANTREAERAERLRPFRSAIDERVTAYLQSRQDTLSVPSGEEQAERLSSYIKYLEDNVLKNGNLPRSLQTSSPADRREHDTNVANNLDEYIASFDSNAQLSKTVLERCTKYDPPPLGPILLRLLDSWSKLEQKPVGRNLVGYHYQSELLFLRWLMGRCIGDATREFLRQNPEGAAHLIEWVRERATRASRELEAKQGFGGGPAAAVVSVGIRRAWVRFGKEVLDAAERAE